MFIEFREFFVNSALRGSFVNHSPILIQYLAVSKFEENFSKFYETLTNHSRKDDEYLMNNS